MARRRAFARHKNRRAELIASGLAGVALLIGMTIPTAPVSRLITGGIAAACVWLIVMILLLRRKAADQPFDRIEPSPAGSQASARQSTPWPKEPTEDLYPHWKAAAERTPASTVDTARWSLELLRAIEWHRFEQICAAFFDALGFDARLTTFGADGGVDIHVYERGAERPAMLVQCKAWGDRKVGVQEVRALFGVMAAENVVEGAFITTSDFSDDARAFAKGKALSLIDGQNFLAKVMKLGASEQAALLAVATTGDFLTPTCPSCGVKMVMRTAKKSRTQFWGCVNYPQCDAMISVRGA